MLSSLSRTVAPRSSFQVAKRFLNIHEADSYEVLNANGVKTPLGRVAHTPAEAKQVATEMGTPKFVVKAQVLAGGRGKGHFDNGFQGGVHMAKTPEEVESLAKQMLGANLITKQTGKEGRPCNKLMIAEPVDITHEYYVAVLLDRKAGSIAVIGSAEGGMAIEEVAAANPDAIKKCHVSILEGFSKEKAEGLAKELGFEGPLLAEATNTLLKLYDTALATDATQIEINPMVTTGDGRVLCADAKLNFDDNASFRQKEIFARRDLTQENPLDVEAQKFDLNYIGLDGSIACLVNGAGLAMATMDLLKHYEGDPANFLDVGGSANVENVTAAFRIITGDPKVHAIFVNIFGGIMSCKTIATAMVAALSQIKVDLPIVIRLQGTQQEEGSAILATYKGDTPIYSINDLDEAAKVAVKLANGGK